MRSRLLALVAAIVALVVTCLGIPGSAIAAPGTVGAVAHTYDAHSAAAPTYATTERGPPAADDPSTTYNAVGSWSHGASARLDGATPATTSHRTTSPTLVRAARATTTTGRQVAVPDGDLFGLPGAMVAAKPAIGFADDAVGSAYQGMRSGGGHAIRHLRDEGLIANSGSLASQVSQFEKLTSPILRSPSSTFDWRLGNTLTRGFAGEAGGQQVVVFVAKEGPYQGRVLSAVVPDANQMAQWGLP